MVRFIALIYSTVSEWYQTLPKCPWPTNSLGLNLLRRLFPDVLGLYSGRWGSSQRAGQRQIPAAHPPLSERRNSHSLGWRGQACCNNTQSSRRKHSYLAHRPAVYKDSPPPSLDSLFSLDFRSSEFQPGRHRCLAGSQDDPLLFALNSGRRPGQRGFPGWILKFLLAACI